MDLKYVDPLELTKYNANPYIIIVKFSPPESGDKNAESVLSANLPSSLAHSLQTIPAHSSS